MALWETTLDSLDLNDGVNFSTDGIPEIDDAPPFEPVLIEMADAWPKFVRSQPQSGVYSVNLHAVGVLNGRMVAATEAEWHQRMVALHAVLGPGLHTLTVRRRGMPSAKSVRVAYRGMATNFRRRHISIDLLAPKPVLT